MVFSSNIFLFLFLPAFLIAHAAAPRHARNLVIIAGSYAFYAWWRVDFLALFIAVTLMNYLVGQRIAASHERDDDRSARRWLAAGVTADLSVLGWFKYANFGVDSFNRLLETAGLGPFEITQVILPIGISFYIFQALSYLVDVYRRDTPAARGLVDFAAFIALFPQLIAGPVLRYKDMARQLQRRRLGLRRFADGSGRFMQGFVKKVLIADSIAPLADAGFALANPSTADAWLATAAYTVQLYFDFSGYTDMAIGLGLMLGFRFPENFRQPYVAQSITEFWGRWHMSLSSWLKDYLYVPLGGNRHGPIRTYRNLLLTMVLGGLWHGANWTFVAWGAWHGAILAVERLLGVDASPRGFSAWRWALTLLLVMLGWVAFRAPTIGEAGTLYAAMFSFADGQLSDAFRAEIARLHLAALAAGVATLIIGGLADRRRAQPRGTMALRPAPLAALCAVPLFAVAVVKLTATNYSPFLYFQF